MARYHSKFSNKKHSVGGIMSTFMGIGSIVVFVLAIVESAKARGEGGPLVGSFGMLALALAFFGLLTGLVSYREIDRYPTFSLSGSLICGCMTVVLVLLLVAGIA